MIARLALVLLIGLTAVGCAAPAPISPTLPSATPPTAPPTPTIGPSAKPSSPSASASPFRVPGVTETDWGAIWDALPPGFPQYPGSTPTEIGAGAASAVFDVPASVPTVSAWLQAALEHAGFSTLSLSGPLEDGSMEIESAGLETRCLVRTTVAPLGGSTIVTVLYGAGCPPT